MNGVFLWRQDAVALLYGYLIAVCHICVLLHFSGIVSHKPIAVQLHQCPLKLQRDDVIHTDMHGGLTRLPGQVGFACNLAYCGLSQHEPSCST